MTRLEQEATADVFASADTAVNFVSNTLVIVVAPGIPKDITTLADLNRPGQSVLVCAPQVPYGSATQRVEDATGVRLGTVSEESSVTDVLTKVTRQQADAGLVYVTDALVAGDEVTAVSSPTPPMR